MTEREAMQKAFEIIGVLKPDNFVHRELQGEAWDALRQALAQPEPQVCCGNYEKCVKSCTPRGRWLAEKELSRTEQKFVCDKDPFYCWSIRCQLGKVCKHTAPSRKEWVGMTEGELIDIKDCNRGFWVNAAKIEQLLKDKNT
jgi:hypothetical protein